MINNPFNPQEVKMSNYHPEAMECKIKFENKM